MEEGERIMGMEIRPVHAGESMAWLVTSTDNAPEVWTRRIMRHLIFRHP